jgi:hypothetical protein
MKSHRIVIQALVFLAATVALPAPALASSLLSGYGGPGQGNQAVLGSALVNGPKGGGGSGGSGSAHSGTAGQTGATGESSTSTTQGATTTTEQGSPAPVGKGAGGGRGGSTKSSGNARASGKGRRAATDSSAVSHASFYPAAERIPSNAQGSTIPGSDVLYIILGAAILVSLGLLTRRAGGDSRREGVGR